MAVAVLKTSINTRDARFRENAEAMARLTTALQKERVKAALGGDERSRERHVSRGKMLPRERVYGLIDPGTPFLELSPMAAHGMYGEPINAAGFITGLGRVAGQECVIVCNDATIKGGTYYPVSVKKHLPRQEVAHERHPPCFKHV